MKFWGDRKWCVMDLFTDHATGKLRESSVWSNLIKGAVFLAYCKHVTGANYETMTTVAAGVLLVHEIAARRMNMMVTEPPK